MTRLRLAALLLAASAACAPSGDDVEIADAPAPTPTAAVDTTDAPAYAAALLESERPWLAARVMQRYLDTLASPPVQHVLLAARAEARSRGWTRARDLFQRAGRSTPLGVGDLFLYARSREAAGDTTGAVESYRAALAAAAPAAGSAPADRAALDLRAGLALVRAGDRTAGERELDAASAAMGPASSWVPLLEARALAARGDTAAVRAKTTPLATGLMGLTAWRSRLEAAQRAGDLAGARRVGVQARAWSKTDLTRAEFLVRGGSAARAMRAESQARDAFRAAIDLSPATEYARRAAALLGEGTPSPEDRLRIARVFRAEGMNEASLAGFRDWLASRGGTAAERRAVQIEYATALFYAERYAEVEPALASVATETDARFLLARAEGQLGHAQRAVEILLDLAQKHAKTAQGTQALLLAAGAWHDAGEAERASELYRRVIAEYPSADAAGLSAMRLGAADLVKGDATGAQQVFEAYRKAHPRGAYALEATYWLGRAHEAAGDADGAKRLYREVRDQERDSYYALRASERLHEPFWPLPMDASPPEDPAANARVADLLKGVDVLRAAGFEEEASAEVDAVLGRAGRDRATLYRLAEALIERGYGQRAIRIGLQLQASGPQNRRLLKILYPFPHATLVTEEASERGLEPAVVAALTRRESAFEPWDPLESTCRHASLSIL